MAYAVNESLTETANEPRFFVSFSDNSVAEQTFVLAMVDPDAPTPQNRSLSQIRHFLAGDIKVAGGSSNHSQLVNASVPLTAYLNPSPPPGSDAHRYARSQIVYVIGAGQRSIIHPSFMFAYIGTRSSCSLSRTISTTPLSTSSTRPSTRRD